MKALTSLVVVTALIAPSAPIVATSTSLLESETLNRRTEQTQTSSSFDPSTELSNETNTSRLQDLDETSENNLTESTTDTSSSSLDLLGNKSTTSTAETDTIDSTSSQDASTEASTSDASFPDELKAIWIERHNFFRVAALPWAAGNMRRMGWDDDVAAKAASAVSSCAANTSTGINVYESTSTEPSTVLEEAMNEWVIEPVLSEIGRVVPPAAEGDTVGAGMYNSYSQVVWASTTSVGCAMSKCSKGSMVACEYSPAGNDGKSEWYIHAAQATQCPKETSASAGLCVEEGDAANDHPIAPVPDDQTSLKVYPTFIADLMSTILKAAQARDTPGATPSRIAPSKKTSDLSSGTETNKASSTESDEDIEMDKSPTSTLTEDNSSSPGKDTKLTNESDDKKSDDSGTEESSSLTTDETSDTTEDSSKVSTDKVTDKAETSTAAQDKKTTGSSPDDLDDPESSSSAYEKSSGDGLDDISTMESSDSGATSDDDLASETSATQKSSSTADQDISAKEKPDLAAGSTFEEEKKSPTSDDTDTTDSESTKQEDSPAQDKSTEQEATAPTSPSPSPDLSSNTAVKVKNESGSTANSRALLSPAAIAGIVVFGVVAIAASLIFVRYRKNQQQQQDIMRHGGIHGT